MGVHGGTWECMGVHRCVSPGNMYIRVHDRFVVYTGVHMCMRVHETHGGVLECMGGV